MYVIFRIAAVILVNVEFVDTWMLRMKLLFHFFLLKKYYFGPLCQHASFRRVTPIHPESCQPGHVQLLLRRMWRWSDWQHRTCRTNTDVPSICSERCVSYDPMRWEEMDRNTRPCWSEFWLLSALKVCPGEYYSLFICIIKQRIPYFLYVLMWSGV